MCACTPNAIIHFSNLKFSSHHQISDDKRLAKTDDDDINDKFFADAEKAKKYVDLVHFEPFADTADAVTAAAACIEGKVPKSLKSFLKKQLKKSVKGDSLAILDKNLVTGIKEAVGSAPISLACDSKTHELFRGIRCHLDELMEGQDGEENEGPAVSGNDLTAMRLGLSHSLSRYKLKFSSDKVDTMVIQAIGLLDELDKEINTYAMRVKEGERVLRSMVDRYSNRVGGGGEGREEAGDGAGSEVVHGGDGWIGQVQAELQGYGACPGVAEAYGGVVRGA